MPPHIASRKFEELKPQLLQQLLALATPEWEGKGEDATAVAELREMQHAAAEQLNSVEQASASGQRCMQQPISESGYAC